ncbi:MAG: AbrB/MazE/SpoVT family DNA-binding domain-containing protein [Patescibacteria group bacterium]|nr:AbrB/MazE/SpoVT family DNA-binding domain-containing protein [Patescibacteria group bacterium]MDE2015691.1 AbrB/MazE/SpoVT family DNA-binding domain-containing protein [Patescibacteria group bacterium]MDE2226749.1 AbrB/MazE/SpoVT family DNA-binding domain-containing protein [Patescibacteria group bacterium]
MKIADNKKFHGVVTLGEKGQVVIPMGARKAMRLNKGERLIVMGIGRDTIIMSKLSNLEKLASHLTERLKTIKKIVSKTKRK